MVWVPGISTTQLWHVNGIQYSVASTEHIPESCRQPRWPPAVAFVTDLHPPVTIRAPGQRLVPFDANSLHHARGPATNRPNLIRNHAFLPFLSPPLPFLSPFSSFFSCICRDRRSRRTVFRRPRSARRCSRLGGGSAVSGSVAIADYVRGVVEPRRQIHTGHGQQGRRINGRRDPGADCSDPGRADPRPLAQRDTGQPNKSVGPFLHTCALP